MTRRVLGATQAEVLRREYQRSSDQGDDAESPEAVHECQQMGMNLQLAVVVSICGTEGIRG